MDNDLTRVVDVLPGLRTDIQMRKRPEPDGVGDLSFQLVVDSIPGLVAVTKPNGEMEYANAALLEYFGQTLDELKRRATFEHVHPDDLAPTLAARREALATGSTFEIEFRARRHDGVYRWCRLLGFPVRDAEARIVRWCMLVTDIDERKREEAFLAGEKGVLEMVAGGHSLSTTLEALCRLVESTASGSRCTVLLVDATGTRLEKGAAPSAPPSLIEAVIGPPIALDANPSAMACRRNQQVMAADLISETRWASAWRRVALAHGIRACCSTPFSSRAGKVLGAFAIYYDEPGVPGAFEQCLIGQFTDIASIAVERAHNDAELVTSEARKAAILDSSLDCIITIDGEGRITEFNPAAESTFGYPRDEVIGKQMADVILPPALRAQHGRAFVEHLATGQAGVLGMRVEMDARRGDGTEFPVELAITRNSADGPPSFTAFLRDITDRKRAIEERNWAETQLGGEKRLLEMIATGRSLPDVLAALCNFVEDAAADCVCGVFPIDWSGPIFHNGVAPSLPASYIDPIEGLAVRRDTAPCSIAALTRAQVIVEDMQANPAWQGTPFGDHVMGYGLRSVWTTPIYSLDGEVLGTFAVYQRKPALPTPRQQELIAQVTHIASIAMERAEADAALKRSGALLAEGERLSLTGTFSKRVATGEITWSEQVYRIFEVDMSVPVTLDLIRSRLHPEDINVFEDFADRMREEAKTFEVEYRLQLDGGVVKYVHTVAHLTRDHDGRLEYIGAVQDVSERRRSEEALGEVRSELAHVARVSSLGTLTASIAHEVNQPLSGIVTNASTCLRMLDADPPNVEGARETVRRTIRDGHRASEVITRLRALFSKSDGPVESVDLNEATREVIALSRSDLQRKRIVLRAALAADIPQVKGDRVQLQQVILNLLLNASDAMREIDGRTREAVITTEREEDGGVRVTVRDTGEGLKPEAVQRIFEPFYTTKSDGMGIGLAVSRSIIERHRGRIWAAPHDGPGATFSFSIPGTSSVVHDVRSR